MKKLVIFFSFMPWLIFSQNSDEVIKPYSLYIQTNIYEANMYERYFVKDVSSSFRFSDLYAFELGANLGVLSVPNFSFTWNFAYQRFLTRRTLQPFEIEVNSNYKRVEIKGFDKVILGPVFFIGKLHQFEFGFKSSLGIYNVTYTKNNSIESYRNIFEYNINLGYRYFKRNGLVLRGGLSFNRSFLDNYQMYNGYLGIGYGIGKTISIPKKERKKSFLILNGTGFIGDLQENYIGIGLNLEHFLYNTNVVNVGYTFGGRYSLNDNGISSNVLLGGVLLFGYNAKNKLEAKLGASIPISGNNDFYFYQFIDVGVGYRYINKKYSFSMGVSTLGFLNGSLGLIIDGKNKDN